MDNRKEQQANRQQQRQLFQQGEAEQFSASRKHKPTTKTAEQELQEAQAAQAVRAFQAIQHQQPQQPQQYQQQKQPQPNRQLAVAQGNFARVNAFRAQQGKPPLSITAYCRQMRIPTATFGPAPTFNEDIWTGNRRDQRARIERPVSPTTRAEGDEAMKEEEEPPPAQRDNMVGNVKKGSDSRRRGDKKKPS